MCVCTSYSKYIMIRRVKNTPRPMSENNEKEGALKEEECISRIMYGGESDLSPFNFNSSFSLFNLPLPYLKTARRQLPLFHFAIALPQVVHRSSTRNRQEAA